MASSNFYYYVLSEPLVSRDSNEIAIIDDMNYYDMQFYAFKK
jgi:hypothetical protein